MTSALRVAEDIAPTAKFSHDTSDTFSWAQDAEGSGIRKLVLHGDARAPKMNRFLWKAIGCSIYALVLGRAKF